MLYKIKKIADTFDALEPIGFKDFGDFSKSEKDLENLIAKSLLSILYEDGSLMPIFQERQWQPEADIYALTESGDLVIFELKRKNAGEDALHQAFRYVQKAGRWKYSELDAKYRVYEKTEKSLRDAHKEAFDLEEALLEREFNQRQQLKVIGSAADESLIDAINYWQQNGIDINFLPYRLYEIENNLYFEFFSHPFDKHINPASAKGVILDTNKTYDADAIWEMFDNDYVAIYGSIRSSIYHINKNDLVFLSHTGFGIVGVCKVEGNVIEKDDYTWYRKAKFLTPKPDKNKPLKSMPFWKVKEILSKNFYWAKTIKVPYLSKREADLLLKELINFFD